ncbi:MAG: pilus assembly protein [Rhodobiaceae bacterium]|nr:pilus assembly protein [Rhodobiaceae bacterium]
MTHALKRPIRALACAATLTGGLLALPAWAADLKVEVNHSSLHTLGQAASTIIVGNPAIADISISNNSTLVIFGRSYGTTNLIALDATGRQIANLDINVVEARTGVLTVNRGTGQASYACAPNCVRVINTADQTEATDTLLATTQGVTQYGDSSAEASSEQD